MLGGRVFPGVHHRAAFDVVEDRERLHVGYRALDGSTSVEVHVRVTDGLRRPKSVPHCGVISGRDWKDGALPPGVTPVAAVADLLP
jgi:hypothetical protein